MQVTTPARTSHGGRYFFEQDRDGAVGDCGLYCAEVVERHFGKAGHFGLEQVFPLDLARGGHRGQGAAVEGVLGGDDLMGAVAVELPPFARQGGQRLNQSGMAVPQTIDRPALDKI